MFLKSIKTMPRKIGFRLAVWYSGVIILSIFILFFISYFFLSSTLENRDEQEIQSEMNEISNEFNSGGIDGVRLFVVTHLSSRMKGLLLIRLSDNQNRTCFMFSPFSQDRYDFQSLEDSFPIDEKWIRLKDSINGSVMNIKTQFLSQGYMLQLGMSSELREKDMSHFKKHIMAWMVPLILTGIIFGVFLSMRTLKPLRHIIGAVESIDIGNMASRVPQTGAGDELDELARLFNNLLEKINTLIIGMKQSLDNVAHDLRTPLTRMRNMCEYTLYNLPPDSPARDAHENVLEESDRILHMLNTLMDISEAETGVMTLHKVNKQLKELIFPIFDLYQVVAESKNIALTMDFPENINLTVDPQRFSQAIANILDNAVKFTPDHGRVWIEAVHRGDNIEILIHDTGPGIPENDIDRIWDRLYRGDRSRSMKGLGLGLSLVKAVVLAHKGGITVSTRPGHTVFTIMLPIDPQTDSPCNRTTITNTSSC